MLTAPAVRRYARQVDHQEDTVASNSRELAERQSDEDVPDPNGEWGWNGSFPKGGLIAGIVSIIALFAMLIGNHTGRIEDLYLVGIALVLALGVVLHFVRKRNSWRR
jgi:hypothetical protein